MSVRKKREREERDDNRKKETIWGCMYTEYMNMYCTSRWAGCGVRGCTSWFDDEKLYLNEYEFAYPWHIQTNELVCLSQADKQCICLKSWRDKKNHNCLKCSSLSFSFICSMGHKLELFFNSWDLWDFAPLLQVSCLKGFEEVLKRSGLGQKIDPVIFGWGGQLKSVGHPSLIHRWSI